MEEANRELRAFLNTWRETHDLSPSEMVALLKDAIGHYKPKPRHCVAKVPSQRIPEQNNS